MVPFKTSFESTPTLRSSRHSLSNFSGVSLLSMLMKKRKRLKYLRQFKKTSLTFHHQLVSNCIFRTHLKILCKNFLWSVYLTSVWIWMETYPLTFLKTASFCPFSVEELASRLVLREGNHLSTLEPGVFPRNSLKWTQNMANVTIQKYLSGQGLTSQVSSPDSWWLSFKGSVDHYRNATCMLFENRS